MVICPALANAAPLASAKDETIIVSAGAPGDGSCGGVLGSGDCAASGALATRESVATMRRVRIEVLLKDR